MKIKLQVQVFIFLINLYLCCFSLLGGLSTFSMSTMSLSSISSHASSEWMKADGKDMIDSNGKSFKSHVGYIHSYVSLSYVSLSKFMLVFHLFLLNCFDMNYFVGWIFADIQRKISHEESHDTLWHIQVYRKTHFLQVFHHNFVDFLSHIYIWIY